MDKIKKVKFNKKEKELISIAEAKGFFQWGYRTWRTYETSKRDGRERVLTKSIANKGEWSFVEKFSSGGTRIKTTTRDLDYLILLIKLINK